ncbi:hypothetical protein K7X08_034257 [Anisodus acutangulus]|uniref:Uncharacterized protein n=1 Tax=Anisodus acutangulus TaxID=402998 RepID=A0A9Q1LIF7_9SOLA|nr:hypothetical protein K7X08_034257 [Anisodus acutangulus]
MYSSPKDEELGQALYHKSNSLFDDYRKMYAIFTHHTDDSSNGSSRFTSSRSNSFDLKKDIENQPYPRLRRNSPVINERIVHLYVVNFPKLASLCPIQKEVYGSETVMVQVDPGNERESNNNTSNKKGKVPLEPEIANSAQGVFHPMVCYASTSLINENNPSFK